MTPRLLLAELAHQLQVPTLQFNDQGCAMLACGADVHNLHVQFEHQPDLAALHIWCDIGAVPADTTAQDLKTLLCANLLGIQTGGAVLALDAAHERVMLCRSFAGDDTSSIVLVSALESFIAAAARWHIRLQQPDFSQTSTATDTSNNAGRPDRASDFRQTDVPNHAKFA